MKHLLRLLAAALALAAMPVLADSDISHLPPGGLLQTNDYIAVARCSSIGCNYKVQVGPVASLNIGGGLANSGGNLVLVAPTLSTLGGIYALAGPTSHQFLTYIDSAGTQHLAQPAASDITGLAAIALSGSASDLTTGMLSASLLPAFSGDFTTSPGSSVATLATVNSAPGTFGSSGQVAQCTINGKGLATSCANVTITPAAIGAPTTTGTGASGTWGISISGNSATATALAASPSQCSGGQFATGIAASGNANCSSVVSGVSSVFGRTGSVVATSGDYTVSQVTGAAPIASPTLTGTVTLPLTTAGVVTTSSGGVISSDALGPTFTNSGSVLNLTQNNRTVSLGTDTISCTTDVGAIILYQNATSTAVTLPASFCNNSFYFTANVAVGAGTVTLTAPSGYTINGGSTIALGANGGCAFYNNGTTDIKIDNSSCTGSTGNYAIYGVQALAFNTADSGAAGSSIAVGPGALVGQTVSAAYGNVAVGYQALNGTMRTAATGETAVGYQALKSVTSNNNNTAVGYQAGSGITSNCCNTAIGAKVLTAATSNAGNTIVGAQSMQSGTGSQNSILGFYSAQGSSFSGSGNNILGYAVGDNLTTGGSNNLIGNSVAQTTLTTGSNNIIIGTDSSSDTPTASTSGSISIGQGAKPGSGDVGIGYQALKATAADSQNNVALGYQALTADTTGQQNTALGYQALVANTVGSANTIIGQQAGTGKTTSNADTAVGQQALQAGDGGYNTVMGQQSMQHNYGSYNVAIGLATLNQSGGATSNTVVGTQVGSTTLAGGSNNLLIGTSSATDVASGSDSYKIILGNLLFWSTKSTAAPAVTSCGTNSIDSHANNATGQVNITASTPSSCTISFAGTTPYQTWNHCIVTQETANTTFGYSYTTGAITLTGTSLSGKFDYSCQGY